TWPPRGPADDERRCGRPHSATVVDGRPQGQAGGHPRYRIRGDARPARRRLASTADLGEANAATTPSPVWLNTNPSCASISVRKHLVVRGQPHPHRIRVRLPPTGRTLDIGE